MSCLVLGYVLSLFLILHWPTTLAKTCSSCTQTYFNVKDGLKDRALEDQRRLKDTIVENDPQCFSECSNNCHCMSFNVCGKTCQLNRGNKLFARNALRRKPGCRYYDMPLLESTCETQSSGPPGICCARLSQPCFNGGSCHVNISDTTRRFRCICPPGFYGDQCQITKPKTCLDYWTGAMKPVSRDYTIEDQAGNAYQAFCDFDSEEGIVWNLVTSYALREELPARQPFLSDSPQNENNLNWELFRLSKARMLDIRSRSIFWRATCSYSVYGIDFKDYLRVRLSVMDPMVFDGGLICFQIDFIDVRGTNCVNCTTMIFQHADTTPHANVKLSRERGCSFNSVDVEYVCPGNGDARQWGFYNPCADPSHRCSESPSSTTENWFGEVKTSSEVDMMHMNPP